MRVHNDFCLTVHVFFFVWEGAKGIALVRVSCWRLSYFPCGPRGTRAVIVPRLPPLSRPAGRGEEQREGDDGSMGTQGVVAHPSCDTRPMICLLHTWGPCHTGEAGWGAEIKNGSGANADRIEDWGEYWDTSRRWRWRRNVTRRMKTMAWPKGASGGTGIGRQPSAAGCLPESKGCGSKVDGS